MTERRRLSTSTSNFGVSKRESHDSAPFYERFIAPELSDDDTVLDPVPVPNPFIVGDASNMEALATGSVALVVTSPPYFAGKQYEEELERDGVPASYGEYLEMLHNVFAECLRVLEPGGRIAVNIANLGRKPYRSLSTDVIRILQDELGMLLRGEVIWQKGEGASGSCAWGSFRSPSNPVFRDITERVVIASKGRFDRARPVKQRRAEGLPCESSIMTEDFMALTLDVWSIPPESAKRVGHPAPFPIELPEQLIRLYTYENDLVLDPFMGSGSTLVAAASLKRRYVGYDLDPLYVEIAQERIRVQLNPEPVTPKRRRNTREVEVPTAPAPFDDINFQSRATAEGKAAQKMAADLLGSCGFRDIVPNRRVPKTGVTVNFEAKDANDQVWYFDVSGAFTSHRGGLLRTDTVWKTLGRAHAMREHLRQNDVPLVLLTSHLPKSRSEGDAALRAAGPMAFRDAIEMLSERDVNRLKEYATGEIDRLEGFWTADEIKLAELRA